MATDSRIASGLTLDEFLAMPGIDERPYLEYVDGEVVAKVSPQGKHSALSSEFVVVLTGYARPRRLGRAFVELRHTFGGRSILPDVSFLKAENVPRNDRGEVADIVTCSPDIHVEILSPDQARPRAHRNLLHSTNHGCALGLFIDPERRTIDAYRPGAAVERLPDGGAIDFAPVLPGLRLGVGEIFGWLIDEPPGADGP